MTLLTLLKPSTMLSLRLHNYDITHKGDVSVRQIQYKQRQSPGVHTLHARVKTLARGSNGTRANPQAVHPSEKLRSLSTSFFTCRPWNPLQVSGVDVLCQSLFVMSSLETGSRRVQIIVSLLGGMHGILCEKYELLFYFGFLELLKFSPFVAVYLLSHYIKLTSSLIILLAFQK